MKRTLPLIALVVFPVVALSSFSSAKFKLQHVTDTLLEFGKKITHPFVPLHNATINEPSICDPNQKQVPNSLYFEILAYISAVLRIHSRERKTDLLLDDGITSQSFK
jgi:hypothetical protein